MGIKKNKNEEETACFDNWVIKSDKDISNRDSFYVEDHELMKALKKLNNIENRTGDK